MAPSRKRGRARRVWFADFDGTWLRPSRGCFVTQTDDEGNVVETYKDARRVLVANLGDRLILADADVAADRVASAEVTAVAADGVALAVAIRFGTVVAGRVSVMKLAAEKASRRVA